MLALAWLVGWCRRAGRFLCKNAMNIALLRYCGRACFVAWLFLCSVGLPVG
jgi:hypothetical protein